MEQPNSQAAVEARVAAGRISWTGPLLLLVARTLTFMAAQGAVALVFYARQIATPWHEAGYWWSVCFTSGDIVCLFGMRYFTRREGIELRDLFGPIRMHRAHDLWLGLAFFGIVFPFYLGGGYVAQRIFYGAQSNPSAYILHAHALPFWAVVYSFLVWWSINSATEECTYQAYVLPRLQALTGRIWIAVVSVGFWFTLQHCALGFVPDWRSIICRFFGFLPGCLMMICLYLRTRRLAPLIIAHWPMDLGAVIMTTF